MTQSGKNSVRYALMTSLGDHINKDEIVKSDEFEAGNNEEKIQLLLQAVQTLGTWFTTIHDIVNDASDGLDPRTTDCEERMMAIAEENKALRFELDILKGTFCKMEAENEHLRSEVTMLIAQTMKQNIIITGLCGDETAESPVETVKEFFQDTMDLEFTSDQIQSAKRIGHYAKNPSVRAELKIRI